MVSRLFHTERNRATLLVHTYPKRSKHVQCFAEQYRISVGQIGGCAKRVCDPVI